MQVGLSMLDLLVVLYFTLTRVHSVFPRYADEL